jgi:uncharacterized protein (TIGR02598 family)
VKSLDLDRKHGFTLAEIVLAMLVVSVGVIGIFSLFPAGLQASRDAIDDSRTALLAEAILTDLRMDMATHYRDDAAGFVYPTDSGDVTADGSELLVETDGEPVGRFRLTVQEVVPGALAEAILEVKPGIETNRTHIFYSRFVNRRP